MKKLLLGILATLTTSTSLANSELAKDQLPALKAISAQQKKLAPAFPDKFNTVNLDKTLTKKSLKITTGGQDGNGGDAVVNGETVSLLDLVEPGYKVLSLTPYWSVISEKIRFFVFQTGVPASSRQFTWLLTSQDLEDIQDEGIIRYQGPGELKQIAIQKDDVVVINEPLFLELTKQGKGAALIVHEILISALLDAGYDLTSPTGTAPIREMVNLLFTDNFHAAAPGFYKRILKKLPLAEISATAQGFNVAVPTTSFSFLFPVTYKIVEPRVLIGNEYFKITNSSLKFAVCAHIGFTMNIYTNESVITKPSAMNELGVQITSEVKDDIEKVWLKEKAPYIKEIICNY